MFDVFDFESLQHVHLKELKEMINFKNDECRAIQRSISRVIAASLNAPGFNGMLFLLGIVVGLLASVSVLIVVIFYYLKQ